MSRHPGAIGAAVGHRAMWIVWMTLGAAIGAGLAVSVPAVYGTVKKMLAEFKAHFGG